MQLKSLVHIVRIKRMTAAASKWREIKKREQGED